MVERCKGSFTRCVSSIKYLRILIFVSDGPALIILALVTANIRNCALPSSKMRALDVLLALTPHLTDEAKLDRLVPYVVELLHDDAPIVRLSALRTLTQMVNIFLPFLFTTISSLFLLWSATSRDSYHKIKLHCFS